MAHGALALLMPGVVRLWGPVTAWAAAIFVASSRSDTGIVGRIPDWLTHGIAYAILSLLLARALAGGLGAALSLRVAVLTVSLATLYGISDEFHQSFVPNRDASVADVAKDLAGATAGVVARCSFRRGRSSDSAFPSPHVGRDRGRVSGSRSRSRRAGPVTDPDTLVGGR